MRWKREILNRVVRAVITGEATCEQTLKEVRNVIVWISEENTFLVEQGLWGVSVSDVFEKQLGSQYNWKRINKGTITRNCAL